MEIKLNREYIVKHTTSIFKIKVLEITEKSIYLLNVDNNAKFRVTREVFENYYSIIEEIKTETVEDVFRRIFNVK